MNQLTEHLTSSLAPAMAVICYQNGNDCYLERRDIINGKMTAGIPLTEKCLSGISEVLSFDSAKIIHGTIPSYMLYADCRSGREKYVWYRKPEKRRMFFSSKLGIENGELLTPGLIYVVNGTTLSVYAVRSKRLSISTKLFHAPFFNVYDSADVCLGSAKLKFPEELTYDNVIKYWEDKFWKSKFDHLLGSNPVASNLASLTKMCIETGCEFPLKELKPIKKLTLKSLLK